MPVDQNHHQNTFSGDKVEQRGMLHSQRGGDRDTSLHWGWASSCWAVPEPAGAHCCCCPFFNRNHKPTALALLLSSRPSAWGSDWEKWLLWKNPYLQHQTKTRLKRARATCDLFLGILLDLLTARELVFETLVLLKCMEPSLSPHHSMSVCLHPPFVLGSRIQPWLLHSNSWDSANQTVTYNRFLGAGWGHNLVWCGLSHIHGEVQVPLHLQIPEKKS